MSKQGRRAHVKLAKHRKLDPLCVSMTWVFVSPFFELRNTRFPIRGAQRRKLINRAHAIRGGYQS